MSTPTPPTAVAAVTSGAARRFVIGETRGTVPILTRSTGRTATCADTVAARIVHTDVGRRSRKYPEPAITPAAANAES